MKMMECIVATMFHMAKWDDRSRLNRGSCFLECEGDRPECTVLFSQDEEGRTDSLTVLTSICTFVIQALRCDDINSERVRHQPAYGRADRRWINSDLDLWRIRVTERKLYHGQHKLTSVDRLFPPEGYFSGPSEAELSLVAQLGGISTFVECCHPFELSANPWTNRWIWFAALLAAASTSYKDHQRTHIVQSKLRL
jgi:hypothetical protein